MHWIDWCIVIIPVLIVLGIALYSRRYVRGVVDYVAAGRVDGYWELGLKPWDLAAGELIAREAGAIATDFVGGHNFYSSGNIVCGNPRVVKSLLAKIREELPESLAK